MQVLFEPELSATTAGGIPATATGTKLFLFSDQILPQHLIPPERKSAHVYRRVFPVRAALIATAPLESPLTGAGAGRLILVPSPSSPSSLTPQQ